MCQFSWTTELHSFDPDAPSSRKRRLLLVFIVKTVPVCQCVTFSSTLQYYLQLPWYWNTFTFCQYTCCLIISFLWVSFKRSAVDGFVFFKKSGLCLPPATCNLIVPIWRMSPHTVSPPRPFLHLVFFSFDVLDCQLSSPCQKLLLSFHELKHLNFDTILFVCFDFWSIVGIISKWNKIIQGWIIAADQTIILGL